MLGVPQVFPKRGITALTIVANLGKLTFKVGAHFFNDVSFSHCRNDSLYASPSAMLPDFLHWSTGAQKRAVVGSCGHSGSSFKADAPAGRSECLSARHPEDHWLGTGSSVRRWSPSNGSGLSPDGDWRHPGLKTNSPPALTRGRTVIYFATSSAASRTTSF